MTFAKPLLLACAAVAIAVGNPALATGPVETCAARKLTVAWRFVRCRMQALARGADVAACLLPYASDWDAAESQAEGQCQTVYDRMVVASLLEGQTDAVASALFGGPAVTTRYRDNGDGTVTDLATSLIWEKLSDDGTIHDKDSTYSWSDAFASKITALNSATFAGYADWRVPNVNELQSAAILAAHDLPDTYVSIVFDDRCQPGCTILTCSCTAQTPGAEPSYWSSTTHHGTPSNAWTVSLGDGSVVDGPKSAARFVRAVRGGL